jgi:hypothetical protein
MYKCSRATTPINISMMIFMLINIMFYSECLALYLADEGRKV